MTSLPVLRETADTVRLFSPVTGEELELATAPTDQLAEMRAYIRDLEEDLKLAKHALDAEVIGRMDKAAKWSWQHGRHTMSAPSPAPSVEYDAKELRVRLNGLAAQGIIAWQAVDEAVEVVKTFKPKAAGINALKKLGGPVAQVIAECATEVEKTRRVTLGRAA